MLTYHEAAPNTKSDKDDKDVISDIMLILRLSGGKETSNSSPQRRRE